MNVHFEKTAYLKCIKEFDYLNNNKKIFNYAKDHPQFTYGSVSPHLFNKTYTDKGWIGRKFLAWPAALWSGVVKTIFYLAKAIFIGIAKSFSDKGLYFKAQVYHAARDFQKAFGWLASLVNDKYGQFLIQESEFQKTCYHCFENTIQINIIPDKNNNNPHKHAGSYSKSWTSQYGVMIDDEAKTISLLDYKLKSPEEKKKLIQRFGLNEKSASNLNEFTGNGDYYGDIHFLNNLTFEDLLLPLQYSKMKFALLSVNQFSELTIKDLKSINKNQFLFIKLRFENLPPIKENNASQKGFNVEDIENIPLKDLRQISSREIYKNKEKIPAAAISLFTNDQLKNLKLSELQPSQNTALFFALDEAETKQRLQQFGDQDVIDAVHSHRLPGHVLQHLSDNQLKFVMLSKLTKDEITHMFPWKNDSTEDRLRFAHFDPAEVQSAIVSGNLGGEYKLSLLSVEQLKALPLTALKTTLNDLFPWKKDPTEDRVRFAHLDSTKVQIALESGILVGEYKLSLISGKQLKDLKLSTLSKSTINEMFPWKKDPTEDQLRFAHFDSIEVQTALNLEKLNQYHLSLLSTEQLKSLDFSSLSQEMVNTLFPPFSVDYLKKKHSHWESTFVMKNKKVLVDKKGIKCIYSEKELLIMSNEQKAKNDKLFHQLSPQQRQDLEPRLYQ